MVVRRNKVHYKSRSQQHQFNFPFQLGRGGRMPFDSPSMAEVRPLLSSELPLGCMLCSQQSHGLTAQHLPQSCRSVSEHMSHSRLHVQ